MSRQLKFRVWDKVENRWGNDAYLECCGPELKHILYHDKPENYVIQQFTGLKDKNGKEVYEGDILKWTHPMDDIGVCEYLATDAFAPLYPDQCYFGLVVSRLGVCHFQADDDYEVIGNVFENPELLK